MEEVGHALDIVDLAREQNVAAVAQLDQTPGEHPVGRARHRIPIFSLPRLCAKQRPERSTNQPKTAKDAGMHRRPSKISETVYTDSGLRLPLIRRVREARWPFFVLLASPFAGLAMATAWYLVSR